MAATNVRGGQILDGSVKLDAPNADVIGTLPITNGGTGATTASNALSNIGAIAAVDGFANGLVISNGAGIVFEGPTYFQYSDESSSTTLLDTDPAIIVVDASSGAVTITLPSLPTGGPNGFYATQKFTIVKEDSSANAVTINVASGGTINGVASFVLSTQWDSASVWNHDAAGVWLTLDRQPAGGGGTTAYAANCVATTNPQTFTHNLGTLDVITQVIEVSTGAAVIADWTAATTNTVSVNFGGAPTAAQYRVIVQKG